MELVVINLVTRLRSMVKISSGETGGTGAVYVYKINENANGNINSIAEVTKLTASGGKTDDSFGWSVAVYGKFILVGSYGVEKGTIGNAGAAYLFVNLSTDPNSPQWTLLSKFQPSELIEDALFGYSVAMDDNIAVIGTSNSNADSAYVFAPVDPSLLSSAWTQIAKLTGPTNSWLGRSVAVAGSWIVVGAMFDDNAKGNNAGAAYVYSKTSSSLSPWTQMKQLTATDGKPDDYFGSSVAISKDASTIVVGARFGDSSDIPNSGAAYLFRTTSSTTTTTTVEWIQIGKFVAEFRATNDQVGSSRAIEDNVVVVGAMGDDSNKGSAYVIDTGFPKASPSPSAIPSAIPSQRPSRRPSSAPTQMPSSIPSGSPSAIPSQSPSVTPTGLPSFVPSFRPSPAPVANAGNAPGKATVPWNTIWSFFVSGFVVLGMLACLLL
jgi:hypothetical protein